MKELIKYRKRVYYFLIKSAFRILLKIYDGGLLRKFLQNKLHHRCFIACYKYALDNFYYSLFVIKLKFE